MKIFVICRYQKSLSAHLYVLIVVYIFYLSVCRQWVHYLFYIINVTFSAGDFSQNSWIDFYLHQRLTFNISINVRKQIKHLFFHRTKMPSEKRTMLTQSTNRSILSRIKSNQSRKTSLLTRLSLSRLIWIISMSDLSTTKSSQKFGRLFT